MFTEEGRETKGINELGGRERNRQTDKESMKERRDREGKEQNRQGEMG